MVAEEVIQRDIPIYVSALGTAVPLYTVNVTSQVNGLLMDVFFTEGQVVKKGQLLAQIDQRPYQALLTQYEGNLQRDKALLANALIDLKRYRTLWKQDSIAQQTLATQESLVAQYEGNIKTDLGLIETTKVNLIYCNITSPIDGRIGLRLVDPGNVIQTSNAQAIAVVATHDPMTVIFPVAEDYLPQILQQVHAGKTLKVIAYDRQQEHILATGKLLAVDNLINTSTGTLRLRAEFNNQQNKLYPNQFLNIRILVDTLKNATVVPTSAIQHSTNVKFVYLINANNTVSIQPLTLGPTHNEYTSIKEGLTPGQRVVVNGADKLVNGSSILVQKTPSS